MISLYLRWVAAKRAYTTAQRRDLAAYQSWCAGSREKGPTGVVLCDYTQALVNDAWRAVQVARMAYIDALEGSN